MKLNVYLAGEIHSDWRKELVQKVQAEDLPVEFTSPVTNHDKSDEVGGRILRGRKFRILERS